MMKLSNIERRISNNRTKSINHPKSKSLNTKPINKMTKEELEEEAIKRQIKYNEKYFNPNLSIITTNASVGSSGSRKNQETIVLPEELGDIYNKTMGDNFLSDWTEISPDGNYNISGTDLLTPNGSGADFYSNRIYITDYITNLEKWDLSVLFSINTIAGDSYGFSPGVISSNTSSREDNIGQVSYFAGNLGEFYISMGYTDNEGIATRIDVDTSNISMSADTVYWYTFSRNKTEFTFSLYETTVDLTATEGYVRSNLLKQSTYDTTLSDSSEILHNVGRFGIVHNGGSTTLKRTIVSSTALKNADFLFVGDSNWAGFGLNNINERVQEKLITSSSFESLTGSFNNSNHYVSLIPEIKSMCENTRVVVAGFTNDVTQGVSEATTLNNMQLLSDAVLSVPGNKGITFITPPPSNANDQSSRVTAMLGTSFDVIDMYNTDLKDGVGTGWASGVSSDDFHWNDTGTDIAVNVIRTAKPDWI